MRTITVKIPVPNRPHPIGFLQAKREARATTKEVRELQKLDEELEHYPVLREYWDAQCIALRFNRPDDSLASQAAAERLSEALMALMLLLSMHKDDRKLIKLAEKVNEMVLVETKTRYSDEELQVLQAEARTIHPQFTQ